MGQGAAADPAAAEDALAIEEHGGLARCHGAGWGIEDKFAFVGFGAGIKCRRDRHLRGTKLYCHPNCAGGRWPEPV